eukprot:5863808-Lingulodinium_polyedra.AAC.1
MCLYNPTATAWVAPPSNWHIHGPNFRPAPAYAQRPTSRSRHGSARAELRLACAKLCARLGMRA